MKKGVLEFLFVASPKVLGGMLTIAVNAVLLRYLGPGQYGIYSLCLAAILLADGVFGSAIDLGVLRLAPLYRASDLARSLAIEKAALYLKLLLCLAACLPLFLFAAPISERLFHQADTRYLIYLTCFVATAMLLLRSTLVHMQVDHKFMLYGALELLHSILKFGGIAVLLVFFQPTPGALLLLFAVAPTVVFLLAMKNMPWLNSGQASVQPPLVELFGVVKWFLLTFSFSAVLSRADIFALTVFSNIHEVGIFSGGYVFAMIPELLGTYLAVVLSPRIMPYCRNGRFYELFKRVQLGCVAVAVVLFASAWLGMGTFAPYLMPGAYTRSSEVLLILLPGTLAAMAAFPLVIPFLMFVRPRFIFVVDVVTLPLVLSLYYYAIQAHGAIGAAWATAISRFAKLAFFQIMAWKWARETGATPLPEEMHEEEINAVEEQMSAGTMRFRIAPAG